MSVFVGNQHVGRTHGISVGVSGFEGGSGIPMRVGVAILIFSVSRSMNWTCVLGVEAFMISQVAGGL